MHQQPTSPLLLAVQTLVARSGLFWVTVIAVGLGFYQLDPSGEAYWIVPLLFFAGLWLFLNGIKEKANHRAMVHLTEGRKPKNGQWSAVYGKAIALEPGENTDDRKILACRFQIFDRLSSRGASTSEKLELRYDGFYLVPTGIDTKDGVVKLCGFPDLRHTEKQGLPNDLLVGAKASARRFPYYVPPYYARELLLTRPVNQSLTRIEDCIAYGDKPAATSGEMKSWLLHHGDEVCIFGIWKDSELWPSYKRGRGLPVHSGTASTVIEDMKDISKGLLIAGVVFLTTALAWAVWSLV